MVRQLYLFFPVLLIISGSEFFLPVKAGDRKHVALVELTAIGNYGLLRKPRRTVPAHLHTGIDIKRPGSNYINEPVYPIAKGKVISKRTDGAYAQLIIEHQLGNKKIWSLYEHVSGIIVKLNEEVSPEKPIARFMNKQELNQYGWQFDHFHLEIIKVKPIRITPDKKHPERFYSSFSLVCFSKQDLDDHYYDPLSFFQTELH